MDKKQYLLAMRANFLDKLAFWVYESKKNQEFAKYIELNLAYIKRIDERLNEVENN